MEIQNKKINFLGDSITEGVGASDLSHNYVNTFLRKYAPAAVRNYGIAGTRIARQQTPTAEHPEWDRDFCSRVSEMEADADIVVVFGGVNDHGHGDAPFGSFADRTPDTFCGACHTLFSEAIVKYPEATIVVMTPLHRGNEENRRGDGNKPCDVAPLSTYVDIIKQVAAFYSLPVLDLWSVSGLQPRVPVIQQKYCPDGLHPNDAGHAIIARRLAGFLATL
jgi:lysophospholipase L1-like esterase